MLFQRSRRIRLALVAGVVATATFTPAASAAAAAPRARAEHADVIGGTHLDGSGVLIAPGLPSLPTTTATSFIVADADSGDVLAALNAHERLAPASTLKTLTALTLIPRLKPDQSVIAQRDAPSVDGTKAGIVAGTSYRIRDLFTAMLMMSANDAAVSLADAFGGLDVTVAAMNAQAAYLNADDTTARTPDGLDAPGQTSSAYDLALIFRAGLHNPAFRQYLALPRAAFPAPGGAAFEIQSHDKLLGSYAGMIGGKNGYTVAAQASYVGAATRNGHTIIVAVMRDQPNFWGEVASLFDWGFAATASASASTSASIGTLVAPGAAGRPAASPRALARLAQSSGEATVPPDGRSQVAAGGPTNAQGSTPRHGLPIGQIATWCAVGVGALFFLAMVALAVVRPVRRRRRRRGRLRSDSSYLSNLSRLSTVRDVSDRS